VVVRLARPLGACRGPPRDDCGDAIVDRSPAVALSAYYAGAVGLEQACALVIGQTTSSAMAAIGASSTAKRLALAYVLFKLIAAVIALALFPITTPLLIRASSTVDGVTLLAAYHTAYNVVGVLVLLPLIDKFTRFVERLLPERRRSHVVLTPRRSPFRLRLWRQ
jgi:phosphate:Na+ symporter